MVLPFLTPPSLPMPMSTFPGSSVSWLPGGFGQWEAQELGKEEKPHSFGYWLHFLCDYLPLVDPTVVPAATE